MVKMYNIQVFLFLFQLMDIDKHICFRARMAGKEDSRVGGSQQIHNND